MSPRARQGGFTLLEVMIAAVVLAIGLVGSMAALLASSTQLREGQLTQYKSVVIDSGVQRLLLQNKQMLFQGSGSLASALMPQFSGTCTTTQSCAPWTATQLGATTPDQLAIGASPWKIDQSPPDTGDPCNLPTGVCGVTANLGTGAIFEVLPDGVVIACSAKTPCNGYTATPLPSSCAASSIPNGLYCRELALTSASANGQIANTAAQIKIGASTYAQTQGVVPSLGGVTANAYVLWVRIWRVGTSQTLATVDREVFVQ